MISKKIRFEVFKRDGFQCAYCGKSPPEIILEIDHIDPISKGGTDDINNLITSCFDCNRGKRNILLDKIPSKLIDNLEILKEKENQFKEYKKLIKKIENRFNKQIKELEGVLDYYFPEHPDFVYRFEDSFKKITLKRFFELLPFEKIKQALTMACEKFFRDYEKTDNVDKQDDFRYSAIKYFCGICWNKIKKTKPPYERD